MDNSTPITSREIPRELIALFQVARRGLGSGGGADAVGEGIAAVAAVVGSSEALTPGRRYAFCVEKCLHALRPLDGVRSAAERAKESERADDLRKAQQLLLIRRGWRLGQRGWWGRLRCWGGWRRIRASLLLRLGRLWRRLRPLRQSWLCERQERNGDCCNPGHVHEGPTLRASANARVKTLAKPGVVGHFPISSSRTHWTSLASGPI